MSLKPGCNPDCTTDIMMYCNVLHFSELGLIYGAESSVAGVSLREKIVVIPVSLRFDNNVGKSMASCSVESWLCFPI